VTSIISAAITTETPVSGRLSATMAEKVMMMVMMELKTLGSARPTTSRSVSTSLVKADMISPCACLSK